MTEEQRTASHLLQAYGKQRAIEHVLWVLSPDFGLSKKHLVEFWIEVYQLVKK
jgi:hypothetical protein